MPADPAFGYQVFIFCKNDFLKAVLYSLQGLSIEQIILLNMVDQLFDNAVK
jgi:hypothetical protein